MTASHSFADFYKNLHETKGIEVIDTPEVITPLDLGESSLDLEIPTHKEAGAFPPVSDTITWFKDIDWDLQRERARGGVNNVGLVLAVIGTKLTDLGTFLSKV
jgi:hypothetical protein